MYSNGTVKQSSEAVRPTVCHSYRAVRYWSKQKVMGFNFRAQIKLKENNVSKITSALIWSLIHMCGID